MHLCSFVIRKEIMLEIWSFSCVTYYMCVFCFEYWKTLFFFL